MKYSEPTTWKLPPNESFYTKFKNKGELYSMTLPDWEIAEKYLTDKRVCLDIGGHVGTTALRYANNFDTVYSFEPLYYGLLEDNLKHVDNVIIVPYAASDAVEEMEMVSWKGNSGLTAIITKENAHIFQKPIYSKHKSKIQSKVTDSMNLENIDFIKIDTEGYVLRILKGITETLKNNNYPLLQIEFNKLNQNPNECYQILDKLGYSEIDSFHVDKFFKHESR